jgi:hypothetical protein
MGFHIATSGRQTEKSQMQDAQKEKGQNAGKMQHRQERTAEDRIQEQNNRTERTRVVG